MVTGNNIIANAARVSVNALFFSGSVILPSWFVPVLVVIAFCSFRLDSPAFLMSRAITQFSSSFGLSFCSAKYHVPGTSQGVLLSIKIRPQPSGGQAHNRFSLSSMKTLMGWLHKQFLVIVFKLVAVPGIEPSSQPYDSRDLPFILTASKLVASGGFEPPTFSLWDWWANHCSNSHYSLLTTWAYRKY